MLSKQLPLRWDESIFFLIILESEFMSAPVDANAQPNPSFEASFNVAFDREKMVEIAKNHGLINDKTPEAVIDLFSEFSQDMFFHIASEIVYKT
jgi:hypothetical protein